MGWLVGTVLLVVIGLGLLLLGAALRTGEDREGKTAGGWMMFASLVVVVIISVWTALASAHSIEAGHVGVVYQFGSIKGQITEGFNWVAPWRSVRVANVQVQRHVFEKLDAFSEETQDVFVKATLNIRVSTETIQELYRSVGPNWFEVLVESRVAQNFKDETVKYRSVEIAPNREKIRTTVRARLEHELSPYSIEVVDLLLDNIDFRPEFKAAIEAKQIATQKALEEQQRVLVAQYQAEQRVKTAEGEGGAILAVAEKQAEANHKLSESLTSALIQYSAIQKLAGNIQVMILPYGQNFILDSDVLKGAAKEEGK